MQYPKAAGLRRLVLVLAGAALSAAWSTASAELSDSDAKKILKKNDCFKCHAVDKTKKGPAYQKIAAKYKGKSDGMEKIVHNLTDAPKVKLEDGTEEDHKVLETDNPDEKTALIHWILSQ